MATVFLNSARLAALSAERFQGQKPFPWLNESLLYPGAFEELCRDFPSLEIFELHQDLPRGGGQRPHNRYYLAYERSIYAQLDHSKGGVVCHDQLPKSWQTFIDELNESLEYQSFISRMLGVRDFSTRYAWHVGVTDSEVSPHRDAPKKLGTHIFYFNTDKDWEPSWGGETLVLEGKQISAPNPDFTDFKAEHRSPILNNRSFLFQNTADAWHGVKSLTCPEGHYRRLFNAIFEPADSRRLSLGGLFRRVTSGWRSRPQAANRSQM